MPLRAWFGWPSLASAVLGLALAAAAWLWLDRVIGEEAGKVGFLKTEIAKLDREVAEIRDLRDVIGALLARKQVAEALQRDRLQSVELLEQLARQRPAGVRLSAVREEGGSLFIAGTASSERQVALLLANLNGSPLFERAQLVELRAGRFGVSAALKGRRASAPRSAPRIPSDVHPGDPK